MSANREKPHIIILPEDDETRQIANGFVLGVAGNRCIQIVPEAGGWGKVMNTFKNDYAQTMRTNLNRRMILLIDFDNDYQERLKYIKQEIHADSDVLIDRVFILGVLSEPRDLKKSLDLPQKRKPYPDLNGNSSEDIGTALFHACSNKQEGLWGHELLKHNHKELDRMRDIVMPVLFAE